MSRGSWKHSTEMGGSRMTDGPEQIRQDALTIVRQIREWEVPEARWNVIAATLATLSAALDAENLKAAAEATIQLELSAPVRLIRIGAPVQPPPAPVRERLNELVYRLSGERETEDDQR
jgi:hypothetical protein